MAIVQFGIRRIERWSDTFGIGLGSIVMFGIRALLSVYKYNDPAWVTKNAFFI